MTTAVNYFVEELASAERRIAQLERDLANSRAVSLGVTHHDECWMRSPLFKTMKGALEGVLPFMEAVEKESLVGDEGCYWPVELVRGAISQVRTYSMRKDSNVDGAVEGLVSQAMPVSGMSQPGGRPEEILQRKMPGGRLEGAAPENG
jgi:hypothetical protein